MGETDQGMRKRVRLMMRCGRAMRVWLSGAGAMLCLALAVLCPAVAAEQYANGPALRVGKKVISLRDMERIFADNRSVLESRLRSGQLSRAALPAALNSAWTDALEQAAQDTMLDLRADQRQREIERFYIERAGGVMGTAAARELFMRELQNYVRKLERQLLAEAGGEAELRAALRRRGQTLDEWRKGLVVELFRRDVLALEMGPIPRSPAAARNYFEKNPEQFGRPDAWRLARIRIAKSKYSSPAKAREAAELVRSKIAAGGDFQQVAAKVSDDPAFASQGGVMTFGERADLPSGTFPEEERVAAGLADGALSDVLDAGEFFLIVQRLGHRPAEQQTFEQAFERAEALAYAERVKQKKREMFDKLKDEYLVQVEQPTPPASVLAAFGIGTDGSFAEPPRSSEPAGAAIPLPPAPEAPPKTPDAGGQFGDPGESRPPAR